VVETEEWDKKLLHSEGSNNASVVTINEEKKREKTHLAYCFSGTRVDTSRKKTHELGVNRGRINTKGNDPS